LIQDSDHWGAHELNSCLEKNPVTDYEFYRESLDKGFKKNHSPLNGEPLSHWAISSGSSGPPKKFPITRSFRRQAIDIHLLSIASYLGRFPEFLRKPFFYLGACGPMGQSPSGVEISYISYYNYLHLPKIVRSFYGIPFEVLRDDETMIRWRPLYALAQDTSAIAAVAPTEVISLLLQIQTRGRELYEYLSRQRRWPEGLPPLYASAERLRILQEAGLPDGEVDFSKVWPHLSFVACWTDSVCRLQAVELRRLLGPKIQVISTPFTATEAWVTAPALPGRAGAAIHPGSVIVEFSLVGDPKPQNLLKPWELEVGKDYELYVTNHMGLVRYRMYDILRCTGYYNEVAEVAFVQKSSQSISLGHVCISESELLQSVETVPELIGQQMFFCPNRLGKGLTLIVASSQDFNATTAQLVDRKLCELNPAYRYETRLGGTTDPVEIQILPTTDPTWRPAHSQSKPYLLRHQRPLDFKSQWHENSLN